MIEGLGLLGMRKEAAAYRTMRKYLNEKEASKLYGDLLDRAMSKRRYRRIYRALDAVREGTEPIPYKDIKRFEELAKTGDWRKVYKDPSTISVARGYKGPTSRATMDDWGGTYAPGRARRIVEHVGEAHDYSSPGEMIYQVFKQY